MSFLSVDASIPELLAAEPTFLQGLECVLTTLDSSRETYGIASRLLGQESVRRLGDFAVISGDLAVASRESLFVGFDELFAFSTNSWRELDSNVFCESFTSERASFVNDMPKAFVRMFEISNARKYLSDGIGLNIATRGDLEEAKALSNLFAR
jgi:hypothetical protein